jgi:hypothetical protein
MLTGGRKRKKEKQERAHFITEFTYNNIEFRCPFHLSDEAPPPYTSTDV